MKVGVYYMRFTTFNAVGLVFGLMLILSTTFAQMKPGDRRKAFGEARASVIESLLGILYPGAQLDWDSQLLRIPGENPHLVEVPVYVRGSQASGGLEGVATVELDREKEGFIFQAKSFQRNDNPVFSTLLVVFRADASGHIEKYKKFLLDPKEPVTQIKNFSIHDWSQNEWPTVDIQYDTDIFSSSSFATIEWRSIFDANSGQFVSRLPQGITSKVRGGPERQFVFGISRSDPNTLQIGTRFGHETHPYTCTDPCVVDAHTLLSQWVQ
jgi:hypothetical protein